MTAVIFLAHGFEEIEAISVIDILRRAEIDVEIVGIGIGIEEKLIIGAHNITIRADILEKDFRFNSNVKAIILPGGMKGVLNLQQTQFTFDILDRALENGIYIASICAAPIILGKLGLLYGRKVTCYPGLEGELWGSEICTQDVCVDGNYITSRGPSTAIKFAIKLVELLKNQVIAQKIQQELLL